MVYALAKVMAYQYSSKRRKQYVVRYRKSGLWFTKFFPTAQKAGAFRMWIRQNANVEIVSTIGVLYQ